MVHAGCVFAAGIHPSRTWMSGSCESAWWNACVHRLDLGLYSHPKEFLGNGVKTHVNFKGKKNPLYRKTFLQRRIEPTTLHLAGQRAPTHYQRAIPAPHRGYSTSNLKCIELIAVGALFIRLKQAWVDSTQRPWCTDFVAPTTSLWGWQCLEPIVHRVYSRLNVKLVELIAVGAQCM